MTNLYKESGVDIEKGYEAVEKMKKHIARTNRAGVLGGLGNFGGLFQLDTSKYKEPVLISGTDGVGTKILLAQQADKVDKIGIDCVAMCVNDVLAQGAEPLFFLDYLAVGKNNPDRIEKIVAGVAEGCVQSKAALIGGETAEMPDLYSKEEFDLAGFCVGVAEKSRVITAERVQNGDVLIGLPSSGIHSNGYSLVRHLFFKKNNWKFEDKLPDGTALIDALLEPTRIYVKDVAPLLDKDLVHGISHITGGGFYENLPRMFNDNQQAVVQIDTIKTPQIFTVMQELGEMKLDEMYGVFNMGIGMVLAVAKDDVEEVLSSISDAVVMGEIQEKTGQDSVILQNNEVAK
ncbi:MULTISPECIES: phosphoribosylformylglycinamidine cyclo-ligase [unclassified Jeotgalibaca]|uniref:phosphoribosylformylglycinamidine cyclo-ligase n=1 Tax=unclassified Jeotgalibaca TaxID=2621505 RepID=UPI003FD4484A